jgi:hypothetical protein
LSSFCWPDQGFPAEVPGERDIGIALAIAHARLQPRAATNSTVSSEEMAEKGSVTQELLATTKTGAPGLTGIMSLAGASGGEGLNFSFEFGGFLFAVHASAEQQRTKIRLHANLGDMPYTAENATARNYAMAVLRSASCALGGRVSLTPQQRIMLREEIIFAEPLTPVTLMSRTAELLIMANPYLELLTHFVRPPIRA